MRSMSFRIYPGNKNTVYNKTESLAYRNQYLRYPNDYQSHETVTTLTTHSEQRKSSDDK